MAPNRRLGVALACACSAGVALGFVPNVGNAAVRPRRGGVEGGCTSIIGIGGANHYGSFAGAPVLQGRPAAGLRRVGRRGRHGRRSTVQMVGFDNTFFGVGGPEVVVVLVVGYFVLGPVELVKLVKQAGVLVGQLRDVGLGTVNNLTTIVDDQIQNAEQIASGEKKPPDYFAPEEEFPMSDEDEFEDVTIDEYGRMVYEGQPEKPPPIKDEDRAPFWEGLGDKISDKLSEFEKEEGPLKEASKFAQQLSGAVNEKVMGIDRESAPIDSSTSDVGEGAVWEGPPEVVAGAGAGGAAGVGMANGWKPPTSELGMEKTVELANDVPSELDAPSVSSATSELSIDEQFERLDTIAALEEERASMMQRLEAKIEAKIGNIKNELLELVDEDFKEKRTKIDEQFAARAEAKAAAAAAAAAATAAEMKAKQEAAKSAEAKEKEKEEAAETTPATAAPSPNATPSERSTAAAGIKMEEK
ncbi:unnamed protein product [Ectocarpus sp. CCAP 1310/34]|nr:unnamed protein product [Ectocarpus sp. CCAP 1310/34]